MRGLHKATGYWNTVEARKDWAKLAALHPELAAKFAPPVDAGWRRIDRAIERVRATLMAQGIECTGRFWDTVQTS